MATIHVQPNAFDVGREIAQLTAGRTDIGGIGCFLGVVRGTSADDNLAAVRGTPADDNLAAVRGTPADDNLAAVRGTPADNSLAALTLEHYPAMTGRSLAAIAAEAEHRWQLLGCTIIHRVGRLVPGEPIVLVLTAAAHREPALAATAFLIDWLKTKAPFWKSEETIGGVAHWVEARANDDIAAARWDEA